MSHQASFAYAQARLQARHGLRPGEPLWQRLASAGDLANYLQQAQRTALRPWVLGMQATQSSHAIELSLRRHFRTYVDEVADWLPGHWGGAVRWIRRMPDLPALQHLVRGETAPPWLLEDPELRPFASENIASRLEAMHNSDCASLATAWQRGDTLYEGWLEQWQRHWKGSRPFAEGFSCLARLLRQYLQVRPARQAVTSDRRRHMLVSGLNYTFRRYSFEPAAACAHLGLIALDLEKLRSDLLQRALFAESTGVRS